MSFSILPDSSVENPKKNIASQAASVAQDIGNEAFKLPLRIGARVGEQIIGAPGDVANLLHTYVTGPIAKQITGKEQAEFHDTPVGKLLGTSGSHRKNIAKLTGNFLEPKNEVERFVDDVVTDAASLLIPVKSKIPFKQTLTRAGLTSLGANLFGKGVQDITGSEEKGSVAKAASLFGLSLLNPEGASKFLGKLYDKAEAALPKGAKTSARSLESSINNLKNDVTKSRSLSSLADSEKFVIDESQKVLDLIKDGEISVEQAWAAKRSLNEQLQKAIYSTPDKKAQARTRKLAANINGYLRDTLENYGKKNPQFGENFKSAEEGFGALAQSNFISRSAEKIMKYSPATSGLPQLFGSALAGVGTAALGSGGVTAAGAAVAYPTAKLLYRISKSTALKKYYSEALKAAAKQDAVVFNRELQKLDEGLQRENSKDTFTLLD